MWTFNQPWSDQFSRTNTFKPWRSCDHEVFDWRHQTNEWQRPRITSDHGSIKNLHIINFVSHLLFQFGKYIVLPKDDFVFFLASSHLYLFNIQKIYFSHQCLPFSTLLALLFLLLLKHLCQTSTFHFHIYEWILAILCSHLLFICFPHFNSQLFHLVLFPTLIILNFNYNTK